MIRVALPRGDLSQLLAEKMASAGFAVEGYGQQSRTYRFGVSGRPDVMVRVFSDRDIPIQVALGHYDLGITRRAWVDELLVRYTHDSLVPLRPLDVGEERIVIAGTRGMDLEALAASKTVTVATEYPNLTTRYLNRLRLPNYRVLEVWGEAQAWPPEDADLAVVPDDALSAEVRDGNSNERLEAISEVHFGGVWLIGNRHALGYRDLSQVLNPLLLLAPGQEGQGPVSPVPLMIPEVSQDRQLRAPVAAKDRLRLALPDGHAQRHSVAALEEAGFEFSGYDIDRALRRPTSDIEGVDVKVIRPQDMPGAVARGQFDLALTGRDWLASHTSSFPGSPVVELVDLGRSKYTLGAVVSEEVPAQSILEAVAYWRRDDPGRTLRLASEYVGLADHYAREQHLGRYRVIPISGASEGFVPDDAEILIEGVETGETLRANGLRMIDVVVESTNCVVGALEPPPGRRGELRAELLSRLRVATDASE